LKLRSARLAALIAKPIMLTATKKLSRSGVNVYLVSPSKRPIQ
jgi:hypothetical protein